MEDHDDETWWRSYHCKKHNQNYCEDSPCEGCEDDHAELRLRKVVESGNLQDKIESITLNFTQTKNAIEALWS